jgi:hypothetical protein
VLGGTPPLLLLFGTARHACLLPGSLPAPAADIVETHPTFMRPYAAPAAEAMLTICAHEEFESETRRLGIEFLLQFAEKAAATGEWPPRSPTTATARGQCGRRTMRRLKAARPHD